MSPFAVFDLDGTLIRWQLYHAVFEQLASRGHIDQVVYSAVVTAEKRWKDRQMDFRSYQMLLINSYDQALHKLDPEQVKEAIENAYLEHRDQIYTYTRDLIAELKKKSYILLAISGSHHEIVELVARHYGFSDWAGTEYHQKDGRYTGTYTFPAHKKGETLKKFIEKHGLSTKGSIGVGDSESDIAMLELVERPVIFNPSRGLLEHAQAKGWEIVVERKDVVYQLVAKNKQYVLKLDN